MGESARGWRLVGGAVVCAVIAACSTTPGRVGPADVRIFRFGESYPDRCEWVVVYVPGAQLTVEEEGMLERERHQLLRERLLADATAAVANEGANALSIRVDDVGRENCCSMGVVMFAVWELRCPEVDS